MFKRRETVIGRIVLLMIRHTMNIIVNTIINTIINHRPLRAPRKHILFPSKSIGRIRKLGPVLKSIYILPFKTEDEAEKRDLRKLLTSHKWIYSVHEDSGSMKLDYDWRLELKEDGTWAIDILNNAVDNSSSSHMHSEEHGGLTEQRFTVEIRDEEISEFNTDILLLL